MKAPTAIKAGTCSNPLTLQLNGEVRFSTVGFENHLQAPCNSGEAPEVVYRINVEQPSSVVFDLYSKFDGAIYLIEKCERGVEPIACNDDFEGENNHSKLKVSLDPGSYYVVVDGFGKAEGSFILMTNSSKLEDAVSVCAKAKVLKPGQQLEGSTRRQADNFHAKCSHGARGADQIYIVELGEPARVRFTLNTDGFDGLLHLHRGCPQEGSGEIACNDDFDSQQNSVIITELDAGQYYLVVDSYRSGEEGEYTLKFDAFYKSMKPSEDDVCEMAPAVLLDSSKKKQTVEIKGTTFYGKDDFQPSCSASPGGADVFRKVALDFSSYVNIRTKYCQFSGVFIAMLDGCGGREIACGVDEIATVVEKGKYIICVDTAGADKIGDFVLDFKSISTHFLNERCNSGRMLKDDVMMKGKTKGESYFIGRCGGRGQGPEDVYRLKLQRKSKVRIEVNSQEFDTVLYIRRNCVEPSSELGCSDDEGSTGRSVVETELERGLYFVFVDGYRKEDHGLYSVRAIIR